MAVIACPQFFGNRSGRCPNDHHRGTIQRRYRLVPPIASGCISLPLTSKTFAWGSGNDVFMEIWQSGRPHPSCFFAASAQAAGRVQKWHSNFDVSLILTRDREKDWAIRLLPISANAKNLSSEHACIRLLNAFSCVLFTSISTCSCALLL